MSRKRSKHNYIESSSSEEVEDESPLKKRKVETSCFFKNNSNDNFQLCLSEEESSDDDIPLNEIKKKEVNDKNVKLQSDIDSVEKVENEKTPVKKIYEFSEFYQFQKQEEDYKKQFENAKEKFQTKSPSKNQMNVDALLKLAETTESLNNNGSDSSDGESEMESDVEMEEVPEKKQPQISSEGVEITLKNPEFKEKKKKGMDMMAVLKRKINRIKKENQIYVHKVNLLCWIAHGNYLNKTINDPELYSEVLKMLPSQKAYPDGRVNLKYLEQITKWFHKTIKINSSGNVIDDESSTTKLVESLKKQIQLKIANSNKNAVLMFVCLLRALGLQCRLLLSFRVVPLRPPNSELCSLSTKSSSKTSKSKNETSVSGESKNVQSMTSKSEKIISESNKTISRTSKNVSSSQGANKSIPSTSKTSKSKSNLSGSETNKNSLSKNGSFSGTSKTLVKKNSRTSNKNVKITQLDGQMESECSLKCCVVDNSLGVIVSNDDNSFDYSDCSMNEDYEILQVDGGGGDCVRKSSRIKEKNAGKEKKVNDQESENEFVETSPFFKNKKGIVKTLESQKSGSSKARNDPKCSRDNLVKKKVENLGQDTVKMAPKPNISKSAEKINEKRQTRSNAVVDKSKQTRNQTNRKVSDRSSQQDEKIISKFFENKTKRQCKKKLPDFKTDIIKILKEGIHEDKMSRRCKKVATNNESESDSDYMPDSENEFEIKKRISKVSSKDRRVLSTDNESGNDDDDKKKKGNDFWCEVFVEEEEKWISVDVMKGLVHCTLGLYVQATHPVTYIVAWNNNNTIKDVTCRYCSKNWNTITRKLRVDNEWWETTLKSYRGKITARDREEDEDLARLQLDQPLPTSISEYKNHPLYVLKRHLLKFEAIYPPEAPTLGFIRGEPVYARDCVYTLHSRETWVKEAKVVKPGETPYKIVKARPKYDRLSGKCVTDIPLEVFGVWQVMDYDPPQAENGKVPRNAYGNVDLFKKCMLPKGTVHLQLPGLNKIARKLDIDCAAAVTGFDFHGGWSHPVIDGYIVCKEFEEVLIKAWEKEQAEIVKREREKIDKRVYGNWRRLIKGLFIRERINARYNFNDADEKTNAEEETPSTSNKRSSSSSTNVFKKLSIKKCQKKPN